MSTQRVADDVNVAVGCSRKNQKVQELGQVHAHEVGAQGRSGVIGISGQSGPIDADDVQIRRIEIGVARAVDELVRSVATESMDQHFGGFFVAESRILQQIRTVCEQFLVF